MTIAMAWVGTRKDNREYLYMATDSRLRGGEVLDVCPKVLVLPRSDAAICFAGDTARCYPFMLQLHYAILAHQPARERSLDITTLKGHLLRVFSDIVGRIEDAAEDFVRGEAEFIFGGYSWRAKEFRFWTIYFNGTRGEFEARPSAMNFHPRLRKVAFIGDRARDIRGKVRERIEKASAGPVEFEPLAALAEMLRETDETQTIGGAPQLIRITAHMNTRPLVLRYQGVDTLFGRPLFDYENTDYLTLDLASMKFDRPRKFGFRGGGGAETS